MFINYKEVVCLSKTLYVHYVHHGCRVIIVVVQQLHVQLFYFSLNKVHTM